ncbi:MAG: DUF4234 domain-containing protein [Candidatus Thermoplasmatota archaeon]
MESSEQSVFCTYCGVRMQPEVRVENAAIGAELGELREALSRRRRTDRRLPEWAAVVPYILTMLFGIVLVGAIFGKILDFDLTGGDMPTEEEILGDMDAYILAAVVFNVMLYAVYAALAYLMVDRANWHLEREAAAMDAVGKVLGKLGGARSLASDPWGREQVLDGRAAYGTKRSPLLWAAVIALPLVGSLAEDFAVLNNDFDLSDSLQIVSIPIMAVHIVLMFYFLHIISDDTWKHDQAWTEFARGTKVALARAGATAGALDEGTTLPSRPTGLFVLVSFVTLGLFAVYWWYVAIKDTNEHYAKQAMFEDQLVAMLSGKD